MPKALEKEYMLAASAILKEGEEGKDGLIGRDLIADSDMDNEFHVQLLAGALRNKGPTVVAWARKIIAEVDGKAPPTTVASQVKIEAAARAAERAEIIAMIARRI